MKTTFYLTERDITAIERTAEILNLISAARDRHAGFYFSAEDFETLIAIYRGNCLPRYNRNFFDSYEKWEDVKIEREQGELK